MKLPLPLPILLHVLTATAHFTVLSPPSVGNLDREESIGPCGGFDIRSRTGATEWPVAGRPLALLSTHPHSNWEFKVALVNGTDDDVAARFEDLLPPVEQTGLGAFCLPLVPGVSKWVGLDAVVQVSQVAVDGKLFQCLAVKFVDGPVITPMRECRNSSDVAAHFVPSSSSPSTPSTNTTGGGSGAGSGGGGGGNAAPHGSQAPLTLVIAAALGFGLGHML